MKPSAIILSMAAAGSATNHAQAFVSPSSSSSARATARTAPPEPTSPRDPAHSSSTLRMVATASPPDMKEEIYAMRAKDIRRELESYGVSTKSIFEKKELMDALVKARREEKIPVGDWDREESVSATHEESGGSNSSDPVDSGDASTKSGWFRNMVDRFAGEASGSSNASTRNGRIQQEKERCKKLTVKELKEELESYGLSASYFEKSEFERAVAEARADGAKKTTTTAVHDRATAEESWDPSYRDVAVTKFDADFLDGIVIDV